LIKHLTPQQESAALIKVPASSILTPVPELSQLTRLATQTLVFFGFQIGPFVDLLPSLIPLLQSGALEAELVYSIAETAVMW
jgi:hypothetical protein